MRRTYRAPGQSRGTRRFIPRCSRNSWSKSARRRRNVLLIICRSALRQSKGGRHMTAIRGYVPATTDHTAVGVHSLDQFVLTVPDLALAQRFYGSFGLDVREDGDRLVLHTFGHDHRWGSLVEGKRKRLHHLSFGCYADDFATLKARVEANGIALLDPPAGFESNGFWFLNPDGILIEVKVAPKSSPDAKNSGPWHSCAEGVAGAPPRSKAWIVRPRRLSHVLCFTPDIGRSLDFYAKTLGLRLSDRSDRRLHARHSRQRPSPACV